MYTFFLLFLKGLRHSVIFNKHRSLVCVVVDLEPIPGTLGARLGNLGT